MHIVLLGKNGQVGWELQRALAPLGKVTALDRHSAPYSGDLSQPDALRHTLRTLKPDVIVNAAAYTAVDRAESDIDLATQINSSSVALLAQEAEMLGAWLIHYSTDYVFNGTGNAPWQEQDVPAPINHYGASKLAGEQAIARYCSRYLIFRTSWVYATRGNNFIHTMLRLASEREQLSVINDQIGAPTSSALIADVTVHALSQALKDSNMAGLYHLTATGETSWHDYAAFIFAQASLADLPLALKQLTAITTASWPSPAKRPLNSRLNCSKLVCRFGLTLPAWQEGVTHTLSEILECRIEQA